MTSDPKFEAELAAMEAVATARRASIPPLPEASLRELLPRNFVDARSGMKALRSRSQGSDEIGRASCRERVSRSV